MRSRCRRPTSASAQSRACTRRRNIPQVIAMGGFLNSACCDGMVGQCKDLSDRMSTQCLIWLWRLSRNTPCSEYSFAPPNLGGWSAAADVHTVLIQTVLTVVKRAQCAASFGVAFGRAV